MTNKITVDLAVLRGLLETAAPFASKETHYPALHSVELRGAGKYLVASSTDRYSVAMRRAMVQDVDGFRALIPLTDVRHLLATFKTPRGAAPGTSVTMSIDGNQLLVTNTGGAMAGCHDLAVTYLLQEGSFPDLVEMLEKWEPGDQHAVTYTASRLAKFQATVNRGGIIHLLQGKPGRPSLVLGDADFLGAVMPCRDDAPVPNPADWLAAITPAKAVSK